MSSSKTENEIKILTPVGCIGYGFNEELFWSAISDGVDAIIADCGSTDGGPSRLALGETHPRSSYERDLGILLAACDTYRVPILLGSAGGDGADGHVDLFLDIIADIISEKGYRPMKVISIYSEIDKDLIQAKLKAGRIEPCGGAVPILSTADVSNASCVVAQMGHEPFVKAMQEYSDFDIIVGGRSYDPAPYAAFCVYSGLSDLGIAYHMGKIMECGALCAEPQSSEALAIVRNGSFDIVPLSPKARCTPSSVAAHTLYEKSRPDILLGPGGALDLNGATYEELPDNRTVRVRGSAFMPAPTKGYTIKLEGARIAGYRSVFFGGVRDPILISQIDSLVPRIKAYVKSKVQYEHEINISIYGKNAVMGSLEPDPSFVPKEIAIWGEGRAKTQAEATNAVALAKVAMLHASYPYEMATAANFAMVAAPNVIPMGQICEFCIYHLMQIDNPVELFPIKHQVFQSTESGLRKLAHRRPPRELTVDEKEETIESLLAENSTKQKPKVVSTTTKAAPPHADGTTFPPPSGPHPLLVLRTPSSGTSFLYALATVIRSKNAGPYEITFDVIFSSQSTYLHVKSANVLSRASFAKLYHLHETDVLFCMWWDQAKAWKATVKRSSLGGSPSGGGWGERDLHGGQQHGPLFWMEVPDEL